MSPHIPAMNRDQLVAALTRLNASNLPASAKERMAKMLLEAANTNRHDPKRLDKGRAQNLMLAEQTVIARFSNVASRAIAALEEIPESEFDALVSEANREQE